MKHLIVTATRREANNIIRHFDLKEISDNLFLNFDNNIKLLICGVGIQTTIYELTKFLCHNSIDIIINVGISGAFKNTVKILDTFVIKSDFFGDSGYYNNGVFINLFNSSFNKNYSQFFSDAKVLVDNYIPDFFNKLNTANAVTVNIPENIEQPYKVFLESMEGAAVMMTSKLFKIKCFQIRTVSNIIGITPKREWKIDEAINEYSKVIINYFNEY